MFELKVDGMSCGHCVGQVTRTVQEIDPDAKVTVDLASKTVRIDSRADLDALADAIADAGYPVIARASA